MTQDLLQNDLPARHIHVVIAVSLVSLVCMFLYWCDLRIAQAIDEDQIGKEWKQHATITRAVLENLIAGAVAAILLALTYRWIVAFIDPRDRVIEVSPSNITNRLLRNAQRTRDYIFIGNTATFVSAAVLPVLSDSIRTTGHPRSVTLVLIDLMDSDAVASYSAFKLSGLQTASKVADQHLARWVPPLNKPEGETSEQIVSKVLAAIYLAAFSSLQSGMVVSVYLRRSFTPFRADMTDSEVVLTQESASESAVAFSSSGHFYGWYHKEADAQRMQGEKIDIAGEREKLRQLLLVHPSSELVEIKRALAAVANHFSHLRPLATNGQIIDLAADRVARPNHAY
jgi:hypothetical protein